MTIWHRAWKGTQNIHYPQDGLVRAGTFGAGKAMFQERQIWVRTQVGLDERLTELW